MIVGDGSHPIGISRDGRGHVAAHAVLDRLAGDVGGRQAVDDEDIEQIVAAILGLDWGRHGGGSVDRMGLSPATDALPENQGGKVRSIKPSSSPG